MRRPLRGVAAVLVDLRPTARLRGPRAIDAGRSLQPVLRALCEDSVDLARVRVVCDWIQYRNNFRAPVQVRTIGPPDAADPGLELAVDLRRGGEELYAATGAALGAHATGAPPGLLLEDWTPTNGSLIWGFNALYWQHLQLWEQSTGAGYESALPGGGSDARNVDAVRGLITDLFAVWDGLEARRALPEELYVVELGVGNGNQARTWLDTFVEVDRALGRDYYRRLHYLMGDYSPHVLQRARAAVAAHAERVSSLVLDAMHPMTALGFLRFKAFLVYVSNVYDNLPTDEVASIGQRHFLVDSRAYLPVPDAERIAASVSVPAPELPRLVDQLLRLGPTVLAEVAADRVRDESEAVRFWRECWQAVRLQERYRALPGVDTYELAPRIGGELLRPLLDAGDVRMQVGNGAVASFTETLPLLHPYGRLLCHDLFVTDVEQYRSSYRGPGKYDGSAINWVNGPLLAQIGARRGFDVRFAPFAHRAGSNISTMTAQVRD